MMALQSTDKETIEVQQKKILEIKKQHEDLKTQYAKL